MFAMTQSAQKRCCWHCSIWPDWFTSHQSHNCLHQKCHIPEFMRKCSNLISSLESRVYKKRQTLAIVWEISYSNLETGRYCLKSGVSQTIRKSWQHCHGWAVKGNSVINSYFYYEQICKKYPLFKIKPFHSKNVIPNR